MNINHGFVPRNIDKRAKDLEIIQSKELKEYKAFIKEFQHNLSLIKDKTSNDPDLINPQEQLFIDFIKDCTIKLDQVKYPFIIFLIQDDKYMFYYDWKNDKFWCHYDRIFSVFESKFNIEYQNWRDFMLDMVKEHFKFRPSTT